MKVSAAMIEVGLCQDLHGEKRIRVAWTDVSSKSVGRRLLEGGLTSADDDGGCADPVVVALDEILSIPPVNDVKTL